MLAVAAVSKWASVGVAKGDVAADVGVAAEARSAVVRKSVGFVIEIECYVRVWCWIGRPLGRDWVCV